MAIGRISGSVLKSNLTRNGTDLAFETNLLYLDVTNNRVGIGTSEPSTELTVSGTVTTTALAVSGSTATVDSKEIITGKSEGTNFTGSLLVGHATSGTLSSAIRNTGVGIVALDAITSGTNNTAVGYNAGTTITTGSSNTAIGSTALVTTNGDNNTAIGHLAMRDATSGEKNTVVGSQAGLIMSGGSADYNTLIGHQAGDNISSGAGNVVIGGADVDSATGDRQLVIAGNDGSTTTTWIKGSSSGAVTLSGAFTFPTSDGSADQFLKTDGSGNLSFATVSTNSIAQLNSNVTVTDTGTGAITVAADGSTVVTFNATTAIDASGVTNAIRLPNGTTAQRPSGAVGEIRYNSSTDVIEGYTSAAGWAQLGATSSTAENTDDTATGVKTAISTTEKIVNQFATSSFDSAWYLAITRDEINDEVATSKYSLVHNDSSAFVSQSHIIREGNNTQITVDADVSGGNARLKATGTSVVNSVSFYRIAVGDNTSTSTTGNVVVTQNSDVDSASEVIDSFAHASYRGAKYYISINNASKTEVSSIEALVVHNGSEAFITTYGDINSGSNSLITLTAAINGSNVEVSAAGNEPNLRVTIYKILLGDSESASSGDNVNVIGATTVSSTATTVDSFANTEYTGAFYVFTGHNSTEGHSSIQEVMVISNADAFVGQGPQVSTKGTDQLAFSVTQSGTSVTLKAASTSGSSTTVNGYRVHMLRGSAGASTSDTVLVSTTQSITGTKTFTGGILTDTIQSPGSNANITLDPQGTGSVAVLGSQTITNTTTDDSLTITTTEDSSTAGPVINLKRNSSSVANADYLGQIKFQGENDADQEVLYAKISGKILDSADGSEDGILEFAFKKNGSNNISGRFRSDSLQLLNDTSLRVTGHVELGVLASDPNTTTDIAHIYAKDESSSAEVFVRDEAGNVTKISPHNEKGEWEYFSRNTKTGKTVRVNMEEMIRDIEKLTGKSYIKHE